MSPTTVRDAVFAATLTTLSAVSVYDHTAGRRPKPAPDGAPTAVDGVALGRSYIPQLADGYGNGWLLAADVLDAGKPVADCQKVLQDTFQESRRRTFAASLAPALSKVLTEGTEPADPAQRARVSALWRGIGRGLKGQR